MTKHSLDIENDFKARLLSYENGYHIHHPFNLAMYEGQLSKEQIRAWVLNRFYYQINIPIKDAAVMSNCPIQAERMRWIQRMIDHDGQNPGEGGIEAWLRLGEACGVNRELMLEQKNVLPGVRFAVDAYVNFARHAPWYEGACASLTELFAPKIHKQRLSTWPNKYTWIDQDGLQYFRNRVSQANRDVEHGLEVTLKYFTTPEQQDRACEILQFKLDILWSISDTIALYYGIGDNKYTIEEDAQCKPRFI